MFTCMPTLLRLPFLPAMSSICCLFLPGVRHHGIAIHADLWIRGMPPCGGYGNANHVFMAGIPCKSASPGHSATRRTSAQRLWGLAALGGVRAALRDCWEPRLLVGGDGQGGQGGLKRKLISTHTIS